jgi:hypothetical protein
MSQLPNHEQIPFLSCDGWPHRVYRAMIGVVDPDEEHQDERPPDYWDHEGRTCLCYVRGASNGQLPADLAPAPVWPGR